MKIFKIIIFVIIASYLGSLFLVAQFKPSLQPGFNLLVLGLDPRDDSLEKTQTTDTIILLHFSPTQINLVSLPRDLWDTQTQTKINQIYPLSQSQLSPNQFLKNSFEFITGQEIDRTAVLTTQNLSQLVDIVGGVDVSLDQAYTDNEFPNPEYVKDPSPKIPVYITIHFPAGQNHLDSSNIAYFVRSRKGSGTPAGGGTDLGRIHRQQLLLEALFAKLKTPQLKTLPALYRFLRHDIATDISNRDLFSLLWSYRQKIFNLNLQKHEIPIGPNPKTTPIYDPGKLVNRQWVFLPSDPEYQSLHQFISRLF